MRNVADTGVGAKLNLGCGSDVREGYINIDLRQTHPNVIIADLSVMPWPFADCSASEIMMLDFLEHLPYGLTRRVLLECYRVLEEKGTLIVQVPDGTHLTRALAQEGKYLCNRDGGDMYVSRYEDSTNLTACPKCGQSADDISEAAMRRLYGGQDYAGNFHNTCFTQRSLSRKLQECGFGSFVFEEHDHMWANWSLKTRATKADLW